MEQRTIETRDGSSLAVSLWSPSREDAPGVVLIADLWGLDDGARSFAARLCVRGLRVLGFDATRGTAPPARDASGAELVAAARAFADREVLADADSALAELTRSGTASGSVGIVGLGWGALPAFLAACTRRSVGAVACLGGTLAREELDARRPLHPLEMVLNLDVPLLRVHVADDPRSSAEESAELLETLRRAHRTFEWVEARGGVGLLDPAAPGYDESVATRVQETSVAFLLEALDPS